MQRPSDGQADAAGHPEPQPARAADASRGPGDTGRERRKNPRLRELVDEMLASVRAAVRRDLWTEEERRQYEEELAEVMRRVRFEAVWKGETGARGKPQ